MQATAPYTGRNRPIQGPATGFWLGGFFVPANGKTKPQGGNPGAIGKVFSAFGKGYQMNSSIAGKQAKEKPQDGQGGGYVN